jgi:hypothetical protein
VPKEGIDASRKMNAAAESPNPADGRVPQPITGIYQGRHVWQVARLLFEQRMMASGRSYTNQPSFLGPKPKADTDSPTENDYPYFGPPPKGKELGPGTRASSLPDDPLFRTS